MLSLSLRVAVLLWRESKSTVTPKGIPISSVRAYRRPMEPPLSSILWEMPRDLRPLATHIGREGNQELLQSLKEKREEREGGSEGGERGRRERLGRKEKQLLKRNTNYEKPYPIYKI